MKLAGNSLKTLFRGLAVGALAVAATACEGGDHAARTKGGMCLQHDQRGADEIEKLFHRFEAVTGTRLKISGRYQDFSVAVVKWGNKPGAAAQVAALPVAIAGILEGEEKERTEIPRLRDCAYQQTRIEATVLLDLIDAYHARFNPAPL